MTDTAEFFARNAAWFENGVWDDDDMGKDVMALFVLGDIAVEPSLSSIQHCMFLRPT